MIYPKEKKTKQGKGILGGLQFDPEVPHQEGVLLNKDLKEVREGCVKLSGRKLSYVSLTKMPSRTK